LSHRQFDFLDLPVEQSNAELLRLNRRRSEGLCLPSGSSKILQDPRHPPIAHRIEARQEGFAVRPIDDRDFEHAREAMARTGR
jgi:hypothetical protein